MLLQQHQLPSSRNWRKYEQLIRDRRWQTLQKVIDRLPTNEVHSANSALPDRSVALTLLGRLPQTLQPVFLRSCSCQCANRRDSSVSGAKECFPSTRLFYDSAAACLPYTANALAFSSSGSFSSVSPAPQLFAFAQMSKRFPQLEITVTKRFWQLWRTRNLNNYDRLHLMLHFFGHFRGV